MRWRAWPPRPYPQVSRPVLLLCLDDSLPNDVKGVIKTKEEEIKQ
jgi:hypothetical protein